MYVGARPCKVVKGRRVVSGGQLFELVQGHSRW